MSRKHTRNPSGLPSGVPGGLLKPRRGQPIWLTIVLAVVALGVWYARQQGWVGSGGSGTGSGTPSTREAARASSTDNDRTSGIDEPEEDNSTAAERASRPAVSADKIITLFREKRDKVWVEGSGTVDRVLSDDDTPPRHQRFLLLLPGGHKVMVAHNIDVGRRAEVNARDNVAFRGEYVWTEQGGKIHFTHKPQYGNFKGGWIEVGGKRYD